MPNQLWSAAADGFAVGPAYVDPEVATVQALWSDEDGVQVSVALHVDGLMSASQALELSCMVQRAASTPAPGVRPVSVRLSPVGAGAACRVVECAYRVA